MFRNLHIKRLEIRERATGGAITETCVNYWYRVFGNILVGYEEDMFADVTWIGNDYRPNNFTVYIKIGKLYFQAGIIGGNKEFLGVSRNLLTSIIQ